MSDVNGVGKLFSHEIEPKYNGYQLIGDNQFLRFSESLLSIKCTKHNGLKFSGLCVRDQKIIDLLRRIHIGFGDISEKIVLMIGTNDLLCGTTPEAMCEDFKELLELLSKDAQKIILLTVPPVPKLAKNKDHWNRLKKFNDFIKQCRDDEKIFVGDAYAQFVVSEELRSRKSCPSNSEVQVTQYSSCPIPTPIRCPKPTPIRFSKWLLTSVANGDKRFGRLMPSPNLSSVGKLFPAIKRFQPTSRPLPPEQGVTSVQKAIHQRTFFFDPSLSDDSKSPVAKRCGYPPTESKNWSSMSENCVHSSKIPSCCSDDLSTAPSRMSPNTEKKRNSYLLPLSSSSSNDSTPLKRALTPDSSVSLTTPYSSENESFSTPSRKACVVDRKYNSPYYPPSSSLFTRRVVKGSVSCQGNHSSGCDNSSTILSERARMLERKYNSPYFPPSSPLFTRRVIGDSVSCLGNSSGSDDPSTIPSKRARTLETKCNSLYSSPPSLHGDDHSFPLSTSFAPQRKCESYFSPTSSSGSEEPYSISSKRKTVDEEFAPYSNPRSIFCGADNSLESPLKRAVSPEKKSNSSLFLTTASSGDSDSCMSSSKKLFTSKNGRNLYSRTDDNCIDSYGKESIEDEHADKIRDECFEVCFSDDCKRPDLIHLNNRGLCALRGIIQGIIDIIDDNYS